MIINENRLHGSLKILENKAIQISKDPKYILDGTTLKFDKQPITIAKTENNRIEGTIYPTLVNGEKLNAAINPNAGSFMQYMYGNPPDASDGVQIIDISEVQNGSIITWVNPPDASGDFGKPGEQYYWSKYGKIYMNPDSASAFSDLKNITYINLMGLDASKVTDMSFMFDHCAAFIIDGLSNWDTSNVTDMSCMFAQCRNITSLDLSSFNISKVTRMGEMFAFCSSITSLNLSSFDTSSVDDMGQMFQFCSKLTTLTLSSLFNTANVTDMHQMFVNCSLLTSLDLSSFNTSNVTDMSEMFSYCDKLTSLDLSMFNTSNVTDMSMMFCYSRLLATITYGATFVNTSILNMDKTDFSNGTFEMFDNTIANKPNWTDGVWDEKGTFNNKNTTLAVGYVINNAIDTNATSFIRSTTPPDTGGGV